MAGDFTTGATIIADFQDNAANTDVLVTVGPNNGTLTGAGNTAASSVTGPNTRYPRSLSLVGTATPDRIVFPNHASLTPAGVFSIGIWAFSTNWKPGSSYGALVAKTNTVAANTTFELRIQQIAGTPEFVVYAGGVFSVHVAGDISSLNNTWVHFGAVYDGSNLRQYINGVANGVAVARTGAPGSTTEALTIGIRNNSSPSLPFTGRVAGFRFFANRALTAEDFAAWAAATNPDAVAASNFGMSMAMGMRM